MSKAFTLLEMLLVVAIIASLSGIILATLNPAQRLESANTTKYLANARDLEKAIQAYVIDNGGQFPAELQARFDQGMTIIPVCKAGQNCDGVDFTNSLISGGYISSIPENPGYTSSVYTGIEINYQIESNQITVVNGIETICASANEGLALNISASAGKVFKKVRFASYGTPTGSCGSYATSTCHAVNSAQIVGTYLIGNSSGSIPATNTIFGDPCGGTFKRLYVEMEY